MQANRPATRTAQGRPQEAPGTGPHCHSLVLVVAITSMEMHLVHQGGQPVTGSLLAFGLLNINTFLLLLFTFLIFRHLSKLFLERRRKVFGSRLRTRLVLTFITLTLLPTLFLFIMAWQLISSRLDNSWDRQVEESLDKAVDLTRTFSLDLEDNLRAFGRVFSQELQEQNNWTTGDRDFFQAFADRNRSAYHLTGLEVFDVHQTPLAASYDPRMGKLPPCRRLSPERLPRKSDHPAESPGPMNSSTSRCR